MSYPNISWQDCHILTETFSVVDGHSLQCDIIVPPDLRPGRHPLIIAYHGGYLIAGARDFYAFMGPWIPSFAAASSAIILSPDHRLLPSADAGNIREDLEALWSWVVSILPTVVESKLEGHEVDLDRILLEGHSAGGFCASHLAMSHPDQIKAVLLTYPMLHNHSRYLADGPPNPPSEWNGFPLLSGSDLDTKIEEEKSKGWIMSRREPQDLNFTISTVKSGRFGKLFGAEQHDPIYRVKNADGHGLPPKVWILHGKDDTGVPVQGSIDFVEEVKNSGWKTDMVLDVVEDEPSEHGFDRTWDISKKRLTDRLEWISRSWLQKD